MVVNDHPTLAAFDVGSSVTRRQALRLPVLEKALSFTQPLEAALLELMEFLFQLV
jgi:hypothetical protein